MSALKLQELFLRIEKLETRVQDLEEIGPKPFLSTRQAAKLLGISTKTLTLYRDTYWTNGIHFFRENRKAIKYNSELLIDWQRNRGNPVAHEKTVQRWIRENKKR